MTSGVRTSAVVIACRIRRGAGDAFFQYAVVEFNDSSGNRQQAELSNTPAPVGGPVGIIFDPDRPTDAVEDSYSSCGF